MFSDELVDLLVLASFVSGGGVDPGKTCEYNLVYVGEIHEQIVVVDIFRAKGDGGVKIKKSWLIMPSTPALRGHGVHRPDHDECTCLRVIRWRRRCYLGSPKTNDRAEKIVHISNRSSVCANSLK